MDESYKCGKVVELITPARFIFDAGQTPKAWNEKMLNDEHFKIISYEPDGSKVFPNTEIKGGYLFLLGIYIKIMEPLKYLPLLKNSIK